MYAIVDEVKFTVKCFLEHFWMYSSVLEVYYSYEVQFHGTGDYLKPLPYKSLLTY